MSAIMQACAIDWPLPFVGVRASRQPKQCATTQELSRFIDRFCFAGRTAASRKCGREESG